MYIKGVSQNETSALLCLGLPQNYYTIFYTQHLCLAFRKSQFVYIKKPIWQRRKKIKKYCYICIAYLKKPRQNKFLFHGVAHFILLGLGFVSVAALTNVFLRKFSSEQIIILQSINSKINIFKSFLKIKFILY